MKAAPLFVVLAGAFLQAGAQQPVKRILLEEFSTAPCGFCPDGDLIAAQIVASQPSVIWVTHHAGFGTDSMTVPESVPVAGAFTTFAPGACIDRGDYPIPVYTIPPYIAVSRQKWDSIVGAHLNDPPVVDIGLVNAYDSVTRLLDCTVTMQFIDAPPPGDIRVNLWLMEDSVVGIGPGYDQTNYYNTSVGHPFYGAGDPIVGYVHHHVLRKVATGAWGLAGIIPSAPAAGSQFVQGFTGLAIPPGWKDDDMQVIAFVSYYNASASQRPVINAQMKALKNYAATHTGEPSGPVAVTVSPNPSSGSLSFSGDPGIDDRTVSLFGLQGQVVLQAVWLAGDPVLRLSTEALENGLYVYRVVSPGVSAGGTVAVMH